MNIPDIKYFESKGAKGNEKKIKKLFPEFYNFIYKNYPDIPWREKLYCFYNKLTEPPKCECGQNLKFVNFVDGYRHYCSNKCRYQSKILRNKISISNKSKSKEERDKITKKRNDTNLSKYGCLNPGSEKAKQTNLKKYGVENPFASKDIQGKIKQTCLEKYGVDNPMKSEEIKQKFENTLLKKYGVKHYKQLPEFNTYVDVSDNDNIIKKRKCPHPECNKCCEKWYEINDGAYHDRRQNKIEPCTRLYPIQKFRNHNTSIEQFIQDILLINGIEFETGNKTILNGYELDIFIPSKNIAVECNGIYWHSSQNNTPHNKHWDKFKKCSEKGIQLLTFWEDQIKLHPEKVEQILLSKLGIFDRRIGARKCSIVELDFKKSNDFINKFHIQGDAHGECVRIGLEYKNELISVMTFGRSRYSKNAEWELYRYCTKSGCQVIGGASKLLKYFENHYNPSIIESFASNDISNGDLYKKLGFKLIKEYSPSYWYINKINLKRYHRSHFTKKNLIKMGHDSSKSEIQITNDLGYYRIFDCGQSKYIKTLNN